MKYPYLVISIIIVLGIAIAFAADLQQGEKVTNSGEASTTQGWKVVELDDGWDVKFNNQEEQSTKICLYNPSARSIEEIDLNKNLYNEKDILITTLTREATSISADSDFGYCYTIDKESYIKFGEHSTILVYQNENIINYQFDWGETNVTLLKDGDLFEDIFVYWNETKWKFGANDTSLEEGELGHYMYVINSTSSLIDASMNVKYSWIIDEETNETDSVNITVPIFYNYHNNEDDFWNEHRQWYGFNDICFNEYANCSYNHYGTSAIIDFYSYSQIDPDIQNVSACATLLSNDTYYQLNTSLSSPGASCILIGAENITLDFNGYTIDGNSAGADLEYGVKSNSSDTTILNAKITDFTYGLWVVNGDNLNVTDSDLSDNGPDNSGGAFNSGYNIYIDNCDNVFMHNVTSDDVTESFVACFLEGTEISMPEGKKNIEDISVGDKVLSYNGKELTSDVVSIIRHSAEEVDGYYIINNKLKVTGNHPLYVNGNWKRVDELKVGDNLKSLEGLMRVDTIEYVEDSVVTYDLEVDAGDGVCGDENNYYADGVLAHNKCLLPETKVTMADGTEKEVKYISSGDEVKTKKGTSPVEVFFYPKNNFDYYLIVNNFLKVTPEQVLRINDKWQKAEYITVGDVLVDSNNKEVIVFDIQKIYEQTPIYDLRTDEGNFYIENILAHNDFIYHNTAYGLLIEDSSNAQIDSLSIDCNQPTEGAEGQLINTRGLYLDNTDTSTFDNSIITKCEYNIYETTGDNNNFTDIIATGSQSYSGFKDIYLTGTTIGNIFLNVSYASETVNTGSNLVRKWHFISHMNDTDGNDIDEGIIYFFDDYIPGYVELNSDASGDFYDYPVVQYTQSGSTKTNYTYNSVYAWDSGLDDYLYKRRDFDVVEDNLLEEWEMIPIDGLISNCRDLEEENQEVILESDIVTDRTNCLTIYVNNITINMNGKSIKDGTGTNAIVNGGYNDTVIKDGSIENLYRGIWITQSCGGNRVQNLTIINVTFGAYLPTVCDSDFSDIFINGTVGAGAGIAIISSSSNDNFTNIKISDCGNDGIVLSASSDINITNLNITSPCASEDIQLVSATNVILLNSTYSGTESVDASSYLTRKWYYRAYVNDTYDGAPIENANVTAYNNTDDLVINTNTDATGYTSIFEILDYVNDGGTKTHASYYNISAFNYSFDTLSVDYNVTTEMTNIEHVFQLQDTYPAVVFNGQTPTDINTFTFGEVNIFYNISDTNLNSSTPKLYFKTNSSTSDYYIITNGSYVDSTNYLTSPVTITNVSDVWNFEIEDNNYFPGTYNFNEVEMEATEHSAYNLNKNNGYIKIELLNVSNAKNYSAFEVMVNNSDISGARSMRIYYCNESYTTGNPILSDYCINFYNIPAQEDYNHTHSTYSSHQVVPFPINITSGLIGDIYVTNTSYFLLRGRTGIHDFDAYYITNISRTDAIQTTDNGGVSWSNFAGTVDAHLHQYDGSETFYYYVCANDTKNYKTCSDLRSDLLDLGGLPPSAPDVYNPTIDIDYSGNISINWTASQSPNGYGIIFYNISLLNTDEEFVLTINTNVSTNLSYVWDTTLVGDADYIIRVEACDELNQCTYGFSELFSIDNLPPIGLSSATTSYDEEPLEEGLEIPEEIYQISKNTIYLVIGAFVILFILMYGRLKRKCKRIYFTLSKRDKEKAKHL